MKCTKTIHYQTLPPQQATRTTPDGVATEAHGLLSSLSSEFSDGAETDSAASVETAAQPMVIY